MDLMQNENNDQLSIVKKKEELILAILSLILTLVILVIFNYMIFLSYKPNIDAIIQQASSISLFPKSYFAPEPVERAEYIISVAFSPFIVFFSYIGVNKLLRTIRLFANNVSFIYFIGVLWTTIATISLFYFIFSQNNFYYLKNTIINDNSLIYISFFILFLLLYFFLRGKIGALEKFCSIIFDIFSFVLIGMVFLMHIFNKNQYFGWIVHFNAVFYSVTQVFVGKTLLVDFVNQYGLYPHFLDPLFHIIGLTVLNYSLVMSALTAICFILIFLFIKKTVSNGVISFLGFTTVLFFSLLWMRLEAFDAYFQYWPIRTIFPTILIFLAAIYLKEERRFIYYSLFILSSIAILWNLDTGIIVFLSWLLLLGYSELYQKNRRMVFKKCLNHFLTAISIFTAVFIFYILYAYIISGSFPDFFQFFQYQQFYYISGFVMLPMRIFHPWNIIMAIYIIGLFYAIRSVFLRDNSFIAKIVFLLTVLGLGLFSYYQGRSHDQVLTVVAYPSILLLTIFADISLSNLKKYGIRLYHNLLFIILLLLILSISICSIGYNFNQLYKYSERGIISLNDSKPSILSKNIDFIKNSTIKGEKILILASHNEGIYYGESHRQSVLNIPGFSEMIYKKDYNKISDFLLKNTDTKVFVDVSSYQESFIRILNQNYTIDSVSNSTSNQVVLLRRDINKSKIFVIEPETDTIFHITSEMIPIQPPIHLNDNFTIQVLVKPFANQGFYAGIVGNHPGYKGFEGFVIQQDNQNQNVYTFGFGNGKEWLPTAKFKLNEDVWNYLVIVVEKNNIKVFNNNLLVASVDAKGTIRNSEMPLYIGNWIYGDRPFNGLIKEVRISNNTLSEKDILLNWQEIQAKLSTLD